MEVRKITGGKVIGVKPDQILFPKNADPPQLRLCTPGTLQGNVASYILFNECARRELGKSELSLAKVVFRDVEGEVLFVMAPVESTGPDVYELKFESGATKAPTIRNLKPLFDSAQVHLRSAFWYELAVEIMQDDTLGWVVAGSWTQVRTKPRTDSDRELAAGRLEEEG